MSITPTESSSRRASIVQSNDSTNEGRASTPTAVSNSHEMLSTLSSPVTSSLSVSQELVARLQQSTPNASASTDGNAVTTQQQESHEITPPTTPRFNQAQRSDSFSSIKISPATSFGELHLLEECDPASKTSRTKRMTRAVQNFFSQIARWCQTKAQHIRSHSIFTRCASFQAEAARSVRSFFRNLCQCCVPQTEAEESFALLENQEESGEDYESNVLEVYSTSASLRNLGLLELEAELVQTEQTLQLLQCRFQKLNYRYQRLLGGCLVLNRRAKIRDILRQLQELQPQIKQQKDNCGYLRNRIATLQEIQAAASESQNSLLIEPSLEMEMDSTLLYTELFDETQHQQIPVEQTLLNLQPPPIEVQAQILPVSEDQEQGAAPSPLIFVNLPPETEQTSNEATEALATPSLTNDEELSAAALPESAPAVLALSLVDDGQIASSSQPEQGNEPEDYLLSSIFPSLMAEDSIIFSAPQSETQKMKSKRKVREISFSDEPAVEEEFTRFERRESQESAIQTEIAELREKASELEKTISVLTDVLIEKRNKAAKLQKVTQMGDCLKPHIRDLEREIIEREREIIKHQESVYQSYLAIEQASKEQQTEPESDLTTRIQALEKEVLSLRSKVDSLKANLKLKTDELQAAILKSAQIQPPQSESEQQLADRRELVELHAILNQDLAALENLISLRLKERQELKAEKEKEEMKQAMRERMQTAAGFFKGWSVKKK